MKCHGCNKKLSGKQLKWCSNKCKMKSANAKHQNYQSQQNRGKRRKKQIVQSKGGQCQKCGYNKSLAALSFHHREPLEKRFELDIRNLSNRKWDNILLELDKCDLLCANCHMEEHHGLD